MRCELQGRWQSWGRRRQQSGDKGDGDGDGDKIKQIGHVQREHRLTINCELSKKQRHKKQDEQDEQDENAEQSLAEFKHDLCVSL